MANLWLMIITTYLSFISLLPCFCHSFNPKLHNVSKAYQFDSGSSGNWISGRATWFGPPNGAGNPGGGGCGYQDDVVSSAPFNSLITSLGPSLWNRGLSCGLCFQIKCVNSEFCTGVPVTVVVADSSLDIDHEFDLSGTSFGAMANPGAADSLRHKGIIPIQYMPVDCNFGRVPLSFRVQKGSNPFYLAFAVDFEDGRGVLQVAVKQANTKGPWIPMAHLWGAIFMVHFHSRQTGPFSVQVSRGSQTIVAENVIPANYAPGVLYASNVNFKV